MEATVYLYHYWWKAKFLLCTNQFKWFLKWIKKKRPLCLHKNIVFSNLWMFLSFKFLWNIAIFILPIGRIFSGNLRIKIKVEILPASICVRRYSQSKMAYCWRGSKSILQGPNFSSPLVLATAFFLFLKLSYLTLYYGLSHFSVPKALDEGGLEDSHTKSEEPASRHTCLSVPEPVSSSPSGVFFASKHQN